MLMLVFTLIILYANFCEAGYYRRNLAGDLAGSHMLPGACTSLTYDCGIENAQPVEVEKTDFTNKEQMKSLVSAYCCALREDTDDVLERRAYEYARLCSSSKFIRQQKSIPEDYELSVSQMVALKYCPNTWSSMFKIASYTPLWLVAKLRPQPRTGMLQCNNPHPKTGKSVKVYIDETPNSFNLKHVIIEAEGKRFGWTRDESVDMGDFNVITGVKGKFHTDFEVSRDAIEWVVRDFDLEKFYAAVDDFNSVGKYSLMDRNCAQVALNLLAAGLHCEARAIPFVPPVALVSVFNKVASGDYWQQ